MVSINALDIAMLLLTCLFEFSILYQFMFNYLGKPRKDYFVAMLAICVYSFLLTFINSFAIAFANIAAISLFCYLFSFLFDGKSGSRILLTLIFVGLSFSAETITMSFLCLVQNKSLLSEFALADISFMAIISKIILLLIVRTIIKLCPSKYLRSNEKNNIWPMMLPLFAILNMHFLIYTHRFHSHEGYIVFTIQIIIGLGLCWCLIQTMIAYESVLQKKDMEARLILAEKMDRAQEIILKEQQNNLEQTRKIIHDFHNQLLHLKELCTTGNPVAENYYNQLFEKIQLQKNQQQIQVGNTIVTSCVYRAETQCRASQIAFSIDVGNCNLSFIDFLDASSLFDNLFDNAICACRMIPEGMKRYITVSFIRNEFYLLIKVQNSKENKIAEKDGVLQSTKTNSSDHGMGLTNVKDIAQKYGGDVSYQYTDADFIVTVSLQAPL